MGSGSTTAPPAPNPNISAAADATQKLGLDWLDFAKGIYENAQTRQQTVDAQAKAVADRQLGQGDQQFEWAKQAHDRYVNTFEPLQDEFIKEADNYASPEAQAAAAASARADVERNAEIQRGAEERRQRAYGVSPGSGRYAGIDRSIGLGTAVAAAGAENNARRALKDKGIALKGTAVGLGSALPAQAAQETGLGLGAGINGANVTNAANTQFLNSAGVVNPAYGGAMTGYANKANILQNLDNYNLKSWSAEEQLKQNEQAGLWSGVGSLVGLGLSAGFAAPQAGSLFSMMSSKKLKTGKRKSEGSLNAVKSMPVERWRYKDGVADGGAAEHTGPYAEDFQKATGHGDGTTIPMQDAIGVTMGAVKELAGQVDRIEKAVGLGRKPRRGASMKKAA